MKLLSIVVGLFIAMKIPIFAQQWTTSGSNISNTNSGNVGVGTSSPTIKFQVLSNTHDSGALSGFTKTVGSESMSLNLYGYLPTPTTNTYLKNTFMLYGAGASLQHINISNAMSSGDIRFLTGGWDAQSFERMIINGGGNVGIGTSTPSGKLEIVGPGSSTNTLTVKNDNSSVISVYTSGPADYYMGGLAFYRSRGTNAAPTAMLAGDRILAIGGNSYINGAFRGSASIEMFTGANPGVNSYPGYITFKTSPTNGTATIERMRISESGYIGINNANPAYPLDVTGTINSTSLFTSGLKVSGGTPGTGKVLTSDASGNATWQTLPVLSQWTTSASDIYFSTGNVSIGTTNPQGYKLAVAGKIISEEVVVKLQANWPDYVFEDTYKPSSLEEIEKYIKEHKHLPGVPSAHEVQEKGLAIGEINKILLEKLEELTLSNIELNKRIKALENVLNERQK